MLRDRVGAAVTAPLTLVATRPDGLEVARTTIAGRFAVRRRGDLAAQAQQSRAAWPLADRRLYRSQRRSSVGRVQFDVADFVPQRLKVTLTAETRVARANQEIRSPRGKPLSLWRAGIGLVR